MKQCSICKTDDCWADGDYAWLDAGWHGDINGCPTSVFFIHGKKIREQRHLPYGIINLAENPGLMERWAEGLPNARFVGHIDTGDGEPGWWIEGERDPNDEDLARLAAVRERVERTEQKELERLKAKYPVLAKSSNRREI